MSYAVKAYAVPLETVNSYPIWENEPVTITLLNREKEISIQIPSPTWDSAYYRPVGATVFLKARQPWIAGAALLIRMNRQDVEEFHWGALDTGEKTSQKNVLSFLSNGPNNFLARYSLSAPVMGTDVRCEVTAMLQVTFQYIGPSGEEEQHPTPEPGKPIVKWPEWWWIAALGAGVGVIAIAGVIAYQEQQKFQMMMLMLAGRRREKE